MSITLLGFIKKELIQALRDSRMRVFIFMIPILQLIVFGLAICTETKNVRLAAIYSPNDRLMADIMRASFASRWFIPAKIDAISNDPMDWIKNDSAEAILVAPPGGLRRSIERHDGKIQLLVNASNVLRAQSIEGYLKNIINRVALETLKLPELNLPFSIEVRVLFNPEMESAVFFVPAIVCMILCILTVILTAMSMAREKELGTFESLLSAPLKTHEILLGKTVPYVGLGIIDAFLIITVAALGFNIPFRGSLLVLVLSSFVFIFTTISVGILISTISKTQQQAMLGGFLFLMPAVLFSGIFFPVENIPLYLRWIAYLDPIQYFITLIRNIILKGGKLDVVFWNIMVLVLISIFMMWFSFSRFRNTL